MISVVIPIYNKLPHLERSIQSVFKQTYQDIELLLIDDSSTDGSTEYIKKFEGLPNVSIFYRTEPGPGGYAARNLGIEKAKGEWIAFLDADDEWYPEHLGNLYNLTQEYPQAKFLSSGWEVSRGLKSIESSFFGQNKSHKNMIIDLESYLKNCLSGKSPVWTSVVAINNDPKLISKLFPEEMGAKRGGDSYAWLKILTSGEKLYWSAHIGGKYFIDSVNQVTRNSKGEFRLFNTENFRTLSATLENVEANLLRRYFNMKILRGWINSLDSAESAEPLRKKLFWKGDFLRTSFSVLISFLPKSFLRVNKKYIYKLSSKL